MSRAQTVFRELLGLFIEDPLLSVAIILWLAVVGFILPRLGLDPRLVSLGLFIGCATILIVTTSLAARRSSFGAATRSRGGGGAFAANRDKEA
jgi:hypothetical protein